MRLSRTIPVSISKQKTGKYTYWCLRWYDSNGSRRGKTVGRVDGPNKISKRQAEVLRSRMHFEVNNNPGRRDAVTGLSLDNYFDRYLTARTSEVAPGTLYLHQLTIKYLLAYFGTDRKIERITRLEARDFKTALSAGKLKHINKRQQDMKPSSVDLHIRNARTIFNHAVKDDILLMNPFDRLCETVKAKKNWHYVNRDEFNKFLDAARNSNWRLILSLCRLAALRRGEALNLEWADIDWQGSKLHIIAKEDWQPKDKDSRIIPICPELQQILLSAYENAADGQVKVIKGLSATNTWKGFKALCKAAGVESYKKPFHTLRKNCITDWAATFMPPEVKEWAGHASIETTMEYYIQVSELEYKRASERPFFGKLTQELTQQEENKKVSKDRESGIVL